MFFSESIYFLILFTLPAALHIIYHAYIRHTPKLNSDKSVELAECIIFCLIVFFVNILIMNEEMLKLARYILAEDKLQYSSKVGFEYINFIIRYFVTNLLVSLGTLVVWYAILIRIYRNIVNVINKKTGHPIEYIYADTWRNVFETKDIVDVGNCVLKIERSNNLITAGLLKAYPAPHVDNRELVLYNTDFIKELFEEDREKSYEERIFKYALYEYYDISNDMLIKFYSTDGYDAYCEEESTVKEEKPE